MTHTIALAGKGGVGKTTVTGILINYLAAKKKGPILAVDADANSNLNEVLGMEVETTLGSIREEMARAALDPNSPIPPGMPKQDYAEMKFAEAIIEGDDFDLLVMGRTQGEGCYCYVNGLLSTQVSRYSGNYRYVVVDNEAGMEHISRGILPRVDTVILVSDSSRRGIQACARIFELVKELKLNPKQIKLLVNRAPGGVISEGVMEEIRKSGMDLLAVLPQDEDIYEFDGEGRPTSQLPEDNAFRKALCAALDKLDFDL